MTTWLRSLRDRPLNEAFGFVFGGVYAVVGIVGFAVTAGVGFAASRGGELIVFELNPLHNIVHLLVGGLFIAGAAMGVRRARAVNTLIGAVYLVVGVAGLFLVGETYNILAINQPDNALHFLSAAAALGVGLFADRTTRNAGAAVYAHRSARADGSLRAGDAAPTGGTYLCSCGDFGALMREGRAFPQCPIGDDHEFRKAVRRRAS